MKIISFEGFEFSGKSTQIKLLQNYFKKNKIKSTFTREPGGNKQLEKIRKIILQSDFDNLSLILFFFASRFSLLSSMKTKNLVVFDRFFDSTYAYQKITSKDKLLILNLMNFMPLFPSGNFFNNWLSIIYLLDVPLIILSNVLVFNLSSHLSTV